MMPSYHPDFIVSCQRRKDTLRCLLAAVKNAEHYARIRPGSDTANTLDFHNDNLAAFMYRNCGFPKGEPAPEPTYVRPSFEQAQHWFNDVINSIPLGGSR